MAPASPRIATLLALLLALLGGWALPTPAHACSCARVSTAEAVQQADAVFTGVVRAADTDAGATTLRFEVDRVYKGSVYADQVVHTGAQSSACGLGAQVGQVWVVFARLDTERIGEQSVGRLSAGSCSGSRAGSAPTQLDDPRPPLAGASDRVEQSLRADVRLTRGLWVAGGAVAVLGAGLALWLGLAWRRRRPAP